MSSVMARPGRELYRLQSHNRNRKYTTGTGNTQQEQETHNRNSKHTTGTGNTQQEQEITPTRRLISCANHWQCFQIQACVINLPSLHSVKKQLWNKHMISLICILTLASDVTTLEQTGGYFRRLLRALLCLIALSAILAVPPRV